MPFTTLFLSQEIYIKNGGNRSNLFPIENRIFIVIIEI